MKLYNKCGRAFIIDRKDAGAGCRLPKDDVTKTRAYIDPQTEVEVSEEIGIKLLGMYPESLMHMDKNKSTAKPRAKKSKK